MDWMLDPASEEPLFRQIARHFEECIFTGTYPPGSPLPTERLLAAQLQVNRSTITEAYAELRASGLIHSRQGSGTRVSEHLWGVAQRQPNWFAYTNGGTFIPTQPLVKRIREATARPGIIAFNGGEMNPELFPHHELQETMHTLPLTRLLGYLPPEGDPALRLSLCDYMREEHGIVATPDQILITSGAQQALHLITQCLLSPGDAIALEGPSYMYSLGVFPSAGLRLFRLPVDADGLEPEQVIQLYRKHKIKLVITNPTYQNPTGTVLSLKRRKRLLAVCEEIRIPVIEDEAYGALRLDDAPPPLPTLVSLNKGNGLVVHIGSFSKTVAPGLRIGWVVAPPSVISRMADAKKEIDHGTSTLSQQLLTAFLQKADWRGHVQQLKTALTRRRDLMRQALSDHVGDKATWNHPKGGYSIWCQLKKTIADQDLIEKAIAHGVLFMPGTIYGAEPGFIRLSYACPAESEIVEGIRRLGRML
ncbi:PLP-dependent aminotransferase family protein [Brevibacillus fluminis]|uniref:PLP-dependent aminotransferase family protein n=1 Tax=Brevibacillus fluminis TaxID=511487 RepID=A0A3M8DNZ7_9BACL|nr:PLP-dependent aminotransferase family protein [Brevibacillus fluminis]RNB89842.1 PLP-dependent aminotransferase family protein [Brevibacillus fluminis]